MTTANGTIRGLLASKGTGSGKVRGIARIVRSPLRDELKKVREGDVLITEMTTPDYQDAMLRAGAYLTARGGILCHAAIIAREFGKVCLVSCGDPILAVPDGAEVEVDAEAQTVRVL